MSISRSQYMFPFKAALSTSIEHPGVDFKYFGPRIERKRTPLVSYNPLLPFGDCSSGSSNSPFSIPALEEAHIDALMIDYTPWIFGPFHHAFAFAKYHKKTSIPGILVLVASRNPFTILDRVPKVVIAALDSKALDVPIGHRPIPECDKVVSPFTTDGNAPAAVIFISRAFLSRASIIHAGPDVVQLGFRSTMSRCKNIANYVRIFISHLDLLFRSVVMAVGVFSHLPACSILPQERPT